MPPSIAQPAQPPKTPTQPTCGAHTVVRGDWLSKLALTYLGDANRWPEIYDANNSVIENAAKAHPGPPVFGTSDHGHWIFPGTALTIPGATCAPTASQEENTLSEARRRLAPELPEVQYKEAATVCLNAVVMAAGKELFTQALTKALKADPIKPPLVPEDYVLVGKITWAAKDTLQAAFQAPDGSLINKTFDAARALTRGMALLDPQEPGSLSPSRLRLKQIALAGKLLTPLLYCAEAAFVVDAQQGARIGAQIRAALP
ncbi:hypothetical protein ABT255_03675 [Streptomyces mirabilis]|uniref:LysM peptidoglycan-binding domain-containing protein n=1 Tax=Streptomyces mirabilis TaxID=68239 RepID=UPI00332104C4